MLHPSTQIPNLVGAVAPQFDEWSTLRLLPSQHPKPPNRKRHLLPATRPANIAFIAAKIIFPSVVASSRCGCCRLFVMICQLDQFRLKLVTCQSSEPTAQHILYPAARTAICLIPCLSQQPLSAPHTLQQPLDVLLDGSIVRALRLPSRDVTQPRARPGAHPSCRATRAAPGAAAATARPPLLGTRSLFWELWVGASFLHALALWVWDLCFRRAPVGLRTLISKSR